MSITFNVSGVAVSTPVGLDEGQLERIICATLDKEYGSFVLLNDHGDVIPWSLVEHGGKYFTLRHSSHQALSVAHDAHRKAVAAEERAVAAEERAVAAEKWMKFIRDTQSSPMYKAFSDVSSSTGSSSMSPKHRDLFFTTVYGRRCVVCKAEPTDTVPITAAHILPMSCTDEQLNFIGYSRDQLRKPPNFIPLCGTKGHRNTCHDWFDRYALALLPTFSNRIYRVATFVFPTDTPEEQARKRELNRKEIELGAVLRRALSWKYRRAIMGNVNQISDAEELFAATFASEQSDNYQKEEEDLELEL
eukprot:TRINITY_DN264_c0_g1_i1.p1 TRINITY_DN264_c0_g1~~TRINITY_DN264_c0_g1_i1.p1  ORF type:complete len:304 (+),score=43.29 TRINITY_DN264_c0_g1_i1:36-947(+)